MSKEQNKVSKGSMILRDNEHLKKVYFAKAKRQPTISEFMDENPNGTFTHKWFFQDSSFKYDKILIPISADELKKRY